MRALSGSSCCPLGAGISRNPSAPPRAPRPSRARTRSRATSVDDVDGSSPSSTPRPPLLDPFLSAPPTAASRAAASSAGTTLSPSARPARVCSVCEGRGDVPCAPCSGRGRLPRGGYSTKNALNVNKAVGTTWTALQRTLGRTHFDVRGKRVVGGSGGGGGEGSDGRGDAKPAKKKKNSKKQTYFLMVATCDDSISLWVPASTLKDRSAWASGWLERKDLAALRERAEGDSDEGGASCRKCNGTGRVPCPLCSRAGDVIEV